MVPARDEVGVIGLLGRWSVFDLERGAHVPSFALPTVTERGRLSGPDPGRCGDRDDVTTNDVTISDVAKDMVTVDVLREGAAVVLVLAGEIDSVTAPATVAGLVTDGRGPAAGG